MGHVDAERSVIERRETQLLAGLPLASAMALTLVIFPFEPRLWLVVFFFSTVCAYGSAFIGVMPLLWLFRRFGWRQWFHFAIAGFLGVFLLWLIPILTMVVFNISLGNLPDRSPLQSIAFLVLPASIAAVAAIVFWVLCIQRKPSHNET